MMAQSLSSGMLRLAVSSRKLSKLARSVTARSAPSTVGAAVRSKFGGVQVPATTTPVPVRVQVPAMCLSTSSAATTPVPVRTIDVRSGSDFGATSALSPMIPLTVAEDFAAFAHANRHQKVRPFILKRRRVKLRTYVGRERDIRHSPWRMNLVCQFVAGMTVPEALKQLLFCQKSKAPLVAKLIRDTANSAKAKDGVQASQLEVAECFSTHGTHLKRLKIMGRGRSGTKRRRHCHVRLVLREIDFPTKLLQARSINQKRKWLGYLQTAGDDYEKAQVEQDELAELEAMAEKLEDEARQKTEEEEK